MCDGCFSHSPNWEPSLQPRHVPWLGIEPMNLWFAGQSSINRWNSWFLKSKPYARCLTYGAEGKLVASCTKYYFLCWAHNTGTKIKHNNTCVCVKVEFAHFLKTRLVIVQFYKWCLLKYKVIAWTSGLY